MKTLRKVKFRLSRNLSPGLYWYLMGKWRPVAAVTSRAASIEDSMRSGAEVVESESTEATTLLVAETVKLSVVSDYIVVELD